MATVAESKGGQQDFSWLRAKLTELYAAEFRRLKCEFEKASTRAAEEVAKCRTLHSQLSEEGDLDRKTVIQNKLCNQKVSAEGYTGQVREMNLQMSLLKKRFEQRLSKISEKESKRDALLANLFEPQSKMICKAAFDRLGKFLFIPHVDVSSPEAKSLLGSETRIDEIYIRNKEPYHMSLSPEFEPDQEFENFMSYSQRHLAKFCSADGNSDSVCRQFVLGILFRALDGLGTKFESCKITDHVKFREEVLGHETQVDFSIAVDGISVFVIKADKASSFLQSGLFRLLPAMDAAYLIDLAETRTVHPSHSFGIVTNGQLWHLVKLDCVKGEYSVSEQVGPLDITYAQTPDTSTVALLCQLIAGMIEEAVAKKQS